MRASFYQKGLRTTYIGAVGLALYRLQPGLHAETGPPITRLEIRLGQGRACRACTGHWVPSRVLRKLGTVVHSCNSRTRHEGGWRIKTSLSSLVVQCEFEASLDYRRPCFQAEGKQTRKATRSCQSGAFSNLDDLPLFSLTGSAPKGLPRRA